MLFTKKYFCIFAPCFMNNNFHLSSLTKTALSRIFFNYLNVLLRKKAYDS